MTAEADSIRAAAAEAKETVTLTKKFYSCVVKDPKTSTSGEFQAVPIDLVPIIENLDLEDVTVLDRGTMSNGKHER
jgi:hypothetical protein